MFKTDPKDYIVPNPPSAKLHLVGAEVYEALDSEAAEYGLDPYSDQCTDAFGIWCKAHNLHYYAAPAEHFDISAATQYAVEKGCKYILLDNLS